MHLQNIGYIQLMNKQFKKYICREDSSTYFIEEDPAGWYLFAYKKKASDKASEDFLLDTFEDALFEAETRYHIPRDSWKSL